MGRYRFVRAFIVSAAIVVISAAPAFAVMDTNTIGCRGSARIVGKDGTVYNISSDMEKAVIPREGTAAYDGLITKVTHDHGGKVEIKLGLFGVTIASWGPSANAHDKNSAAGTIQLPSALKYVLPGSYKVSGFHKGNEGGCSGHMTIEVAGGLTSSPAGIPVVVGSGLAAVGTLAAGRRKRVR